MSTTAAKRMKQRSKRCWTGEEDEQLVHLVTVHGTGNWSVIAEQLGNRTGKQCRERWHNHLNPEGECGSRWWGGPRRWLCADFCVFWRCARGSQKGRMEPR